MGTGGTSEVLTVQESSDTSCLKDVTTGFSWSVASADSCTPTQITWDAQTVGYANLCASPLPLPFIWTFRIPFFYGIVPGNSSFVIPQKQTTNFTQLDWTTRLPVNTSAYVVAGDNRGAGSGGVSQITIAAGDTSCLISSGNSTSLPPTPSDPTTKSPDDDSTGETQNQQPR